MSLHKRGGFVWRVPSPGAQGPTRLLTPEDIESLGLLGLCAGQPMQTPLGDNAILVWSLADWDAPPLPELVEWAEAEGRATGLALGIRPREGDLALDRQPAGMRVRLGDGSRWLVPAPDLSASGDSMLLADLGAVLAGAEPSCPGQWQGWISAILARAYRIDEAGVLLLGLLDGPGLWAMADALAIQASEMIARGAGE